MDIDNLSLINLFLDKTKREPLEELVEMGKNKLANPPKVWANSCKERCTNDEAWYLLIDMSLRVDDFLGVQIKDFPSLHCGSSYPLPFVLSSVPSMSGVVFGLYLANKAVSLEQISEANVILGASVFLSGVSTALLINAVRDNNSGLYNRKTKKITVKRAEFKQRLSSILAHEYTHHIQNERIPFFHPNYKVFFEGHAMGVEKHITETLAEEKKDFAYIQQSNHLQSHLEVALEILQDYKQGKTINPAELFLTYRHTIGHALFQLAERKHGKEIYADALKGNYSFLE
ncbi:MAG: hypothetical protein Q8R18_05895 [bacterium]|nr:hypothetical protein [bacterium]